MIEYHRRADINLVEVRVLNASSDQDFHWLATQIEQDIQRHKQLCILEEIHSLEGINPLTFWKDKRFGFSYNKSFSRAAVVVDAQWVSFFQHVTDSILSIEVSIYDHTQIESARAWLLEKATPICDLSVNGPDRSNESENQALMVLPNGATSPASSPTSSLATSFTIAA